MRKLLHWRQQAAWALPACALLSLSGCQRPFARKEPAPQADYVKVGSKETAKLTEREYLMRRATLGTRSERMEAIDVIDRSNDPDLLPFLLDRLEKEDDRFLMVRIMQALSRPDGLQDVRAVEPIRLIAVKDPTRVGVEAVVSLYDLGDDNYIPRLIRRLRLDESSPELAGVAQRALKRIYHVELQPTPRAWNTYYRSHRLAPYQQLRWYAAFKPPLPPTVAGTSKVQPRPKGGPQLPQEDVKLRRHILTAYEFWKPDEP